MGPLWALVNGVTGARALTAFGAHGGEPGLSWALVHGVGGSRPSQVPGWGEGRGPHSFWGMVVVGGARALMGSRVRAGALVAFGAWWGGSRGPHSFQGVGWRSWDPHGLQCAGM